MEAGQHLFEHVLPIVQKRRADPIERDDLIGFLLNLNTNGVTFTDVDITNFVRMLLLAATETTTRILGYMLAQLFDHPAQIGRGSCRDRTSPYVYVSVITEPLKKKKKH